MWALLKKREVILSEARVLGLGPRFMSIYIGKLAVERRIYYDDIENLKVEWLEATSALVLNLFVRKRSSRRSGPGYYRALEDVAWVVDPYDLGETGTFGQNAKEPGAAARRIDFIPRSVIDPMVFPLTIRLLSTIPVALHAVGGGDGPIDIGVRLLISSYLR
uniref:DIS3-like exonuclease 2 isoform X1 n=1 Tax=Rhizophora mucronata TaxID=61149 RepID=A0A2P2K068_RHIMU